MAARPEFAAFDAALPVLGRDGTLAKSVAADSPARGHAHAKTGTYFVENELDGTTVLTSKALAGYLETASGRSLVFAAFVNNVPLDAPEADESVSDATAEAGRVLGKLCEALYMDSSDRTGEAKGKRAAQRGRERDLGAVFTVKDSAFSLRDGAVSVAAAIETPPGPPFARDAKGREGFGSSLALRSGRWRVTPVSTPPAPPLQRAVRVGQHARIVRSSRGGRDLRGRKLRAVGKRLARAVEAGLGVEAGRLGGRVLPGVLFRDDRGGVNFFHLGAEEIEQLAIVRGGDEISCFGVVERVVVELFAAVFIADVDLSLMQQGASPDCAFAGVLLNSSEVSVSRNSSPGDGCAEPVPSILRESGRGTAMGPRSPEGRRRSPADHAG